jgi:hypothetical protein
MSIATDSESEEECRVVEHIRRSQRQRKQQEKIKNTTSSINIINTSKKNKKSCPKELLNTAKRPLSPYSSIESVTNTTDVKTVNQ